MLLLHVGVHRARYRELVAMRPIPGQEPPEALTVDCPHCGDRDVAELHPYEEWPDLNEQELGGGHGAGG